VAVIALRVEARRRADAVCIADALGAAVSRSQRGWLVAFEVETSADLERLLAALQSCLDEHAIPTTTVLLDDERYLMQARREAPLKHGALS
jgi:hypothetical protein